MSILLDGKKVSLDTEQKLKERVKALKEQKGFVPILATILVGDDPASATYVKMKGNACERIGMNSMKVELPSSTSTEELLDAGVAVNDRAFGNDSLSGVFDKTSKIAKTMDENGSVSYTHLRAHETDF